MELQDNELFPSAEPNANAGKALCVDILCCWAGQAHYKTQGLSENEHPSGVSVS